MIVRRAVNSRADTLLLSFMDLSRAFGFAERSLSRMCGDSGSMVALPHSSGLSADTITCPSAFVKVPDTVGGRGHPDQSPERYGRVPDKSDVLFSLAHNGGCRQYLWLIGMEDANLRFCQLKSNIRSGGMGGAAPS